LPSQPHRWDWLARKTGKPYRLLSEAEWEYAARGRTQPGIHPRFWFGEDEKDLCRYGNFMDQKAGYKSAPCDDGYANTSPAGHYKPNDFGLYDMAGNAWQWTADCWHSGYDGAPTDGSVWTGGCQGSGHVARGGSWFSQPGLRAAERGGLWYVDNRSYSRYVGGNGSGSGITEYNDLGFRVARTLTP
jgi:formylglycine-generating enzyme required for sulfatase activity